MEIATSDGDVYAVIIQVEGNQRRGKICLVFVLPCSAVPWTVMFRVLWPFAVPCGTALGLYITEHVDSML